jgi:DNA-binding transcriptional MerR regulator
MKWEARMNAIEILTTSDVAKELNRSPDRIRDYARNGTLPSLRARSGQRFFRADDVARFARELKNRTKVGQ